MRHFCAVAFFVIPIEMGDCIELKRDFLKRPWNAIMIYVSASLNSALCELFFWLKHSIDLPNYIRLHVYICHGIIHTSKCRLNRCNPFALNQMHSIVWCDKINIPSSICQSMLQTDGTHSLSAIFVEENSIEFEHRCSRHVLGFRARCSTFIFSIPLLRWKDFRDFCDKISFVVNILKVMGWQ